MSESRYVPRLLRLKPRFDSGDRFAALESIAHSFLNEKLPPDWARNYFVESLRRYSNKETKTLGEAFSIPDIKHHAKEHDWQMAGNVWMEVGQLAASGMPLSGNRDTPGAFDSVAAKYKNRMFDCSPAKIRDMYNARRKEHIDMCKKLMDGKSRAEIEEMLQQMRAALGDTEE